MALRQDFTMYLGEDRDWQFTVTDANGAAQNMGGWAMECVLRTSPNSASALFTKTTSAGEIVISSSAAGTNDVATVTVIDDDTLSLQPQKYWYTLRRTDAGNEVVISFGELTLERQATR